MESAFDIYERITEQIAEARVQHERGEIEDALRLLEEAKQDFARNEAVLERLSTVGILRQAMERTRKAVSA